MNFDPYQPPAAGPLPSGSGLELSEEAVTELLGTRAWVQFVSILMLLATGLMCFGFVMGLMAPSARYSDFRSDGSTYSGGGGLAGRLIPILIVALLYLYPAVLLSKYAAAIRRFRTGRNMSDFAAALRHQRKFWRFVGIISCVLIVAFLLAFAGLISLFLRGA